MLVMAPNLASDRRVTEARPWDVNAAFWDEQMGDDGNDFHLRLVRPAVERLLGSVAGSRVLDVACGNGLTSRRMAPRGVGAKVVAFDFSEELIALAKATPFGSGAGDCLQRAPTPPTSRRCWRWGRAASTGALCNMALMDVADIDPLMPGRWRSCCVRAAASCSRSRTPASTTPASASPQMGELEDRAVTFVTTYSVKVARYLRPSTGAAWSGHERPAGPAPLLSPSARGPAGGGVLVAGFALDALEEPAFPAGEEDAGLTWAGLPEIPPVLAARLRRRGAS